MSNNNKYPGTTTTLPIKDTGYDATIFYPSKPVLDSELNLVGDLSSAKLQDFIRSKMPSGWLDVNFSRGFDTSSNTYGINTSLEANSFTLNSLKSGPMLLNVNGWLVQLGGLGITSDSKVKISLSSPPATGSRSDLVFLEIWKALISEGSTQSKPTASTVYKFGNTQYLGTNLSDDIQNNTMGFETTKRVQIQYRVRVVSGVNFSLFPEGVSDSNNVKAQGINTTPTSSYSFVSAGSSFDDYGLYISGDGSQLSIDDLGTVDGYVYAIPMFKVHRRNTTAFSVTNQNGSLLSVTSGLPSDRPDGLYNNQIDIKDIEDLRHLVSFNNFNYQELLDLNLHNLYSGNIENMLVPSNLDSNLSSVGSNIHVNKIATSTQAGTERIAQPNGQQRYYSDTPATSQSTSTKTINSKTVGTNGSNWVSTDQITLPILAMTGRATAVIGSSTPIVKFAQTSSGPIYSVTGSWSGLGTSLATFTFGVNALLTNQNVYITYDIDFDQIGDKLTKPIKDILRVEDIKRTENWGFISVNDYDYTATSYPERRLRNITPRTAATGYPDYAYTYRLDPNYSFNGVSTIYSYHLNGSGGSNQVTIPGSLINNSDVSYVYSVYNENTSSYIPITTVQKNVDNSLSVTLPSSVANVIRFDIVLKAGIVEFDERTQSVVDIGRVDFYQINGNGTTQVILKNSLLGDDPSDVIVGVQTEFNGVIESQSCYIDGIRQIVTSNVETDTSLLLLTLPFPVPSTSVIEISLMTKKTLDSTENLNIYYSYAPYTGITAKSNFGISADSFIESKVIYHRNNLDITTSGTGSVNTSKFLSNEYEPLIPKLPIIDSVDYGDFTGTVHKTKEVLGGTYDATFTHTSNYISGQENYLTKESVTQEKGTNKGGRFAPSAEDSDALVHKVVIGSLLEMVIEDGTGNFLPGELALKIETNYINNNSDNRISSYDNAELNNSFDMFKIEGRPLIKLGTK